MSKLFKQSMFVIGSALLPVLTFAQADATSILDEVQNILNTVIPIVMTLALLYFFWGLATYILGAGDEEKRKAGRGMMVWGIIALFVMAAVWGLTGVIAKTFGIRQGTGAPNVGPMIPTN
ncbi:MAG: pilin [Candidatus Vogelbacteria bacterium]